MNHNPQQQGLIRELDADEIQLLCTQAAESVAVDLRHQNEKFALRSKHESEQRQLVAKKEARKAAALPAT